MGAVAVVAGVSLLGVSGAHADEEEGSPSPSGVRLITPHHNDLDRDPATVSPTQRQLARVEALEAIATWNRFGTPASLSPEPGRRTQLSGRLGGSPERAARAFVRTERTLFRLKAADVDRLEVIRSAALPGTGSRAQVVSFRQRFAYAGQEQRGRLQAADGGLITVGLAGSKVTYVSSSAFGSASRLPAARLSAAKAWLAAAKRLGRDVVPSAVHPIAGDSGGWQRFGVTGFAQEQQVRLVALGRPARGSGVAVRPAYEVNVVDIQDGYALAATSFVDALTGEVLVRHDRVDHLGRVVGHAQRPPLGRSVPCAPAFGGCGVRLRPAPDSPLLTALLEAPVRPAGRTVDPISRFDSWNRSGCDIDALRRDHAISAYTKVVTQQSDMAAWAAQLGFPTAGSLSTSVRSGAKNGGYPTFLGRNSAIQVTMQRGLPSISGHYLFEPVAGRWYGRCADGALDRTLVAHEYAHLLIERLVGGPDDQITGADGELLAESWADLLATAYLLQHGGSDGAAHATAIGGYVAGDQVRGIRDYAVGPNPLNATNRGYSLPGDGADPWSDSAIWTAANWDLRERLGARTWTRLLADSLALQQSATSMPDARDALLAADRLRFGGVHARRIWLVFAQRGLGGRDQDAGAVSASGPRRTDTSPSFSSPFEPGGTLRLTATDADTGLPVAAKLRVGRYAAGTTPVADTDPLTALPPSLRMAPGDYTFTWSAPGYGLGRTAKTVAAGRSHELRLTLHRNLVSSASGAAVSDGVLQTTADTIEAVDGPDAGSSDGRAKGVDALIDDDEATVWTADEAGGTATVDLAGSQPRTVRSVRVSALTGSGERFSALRRFAIEVCSAAKAGDRRDCAPGRELGWQRIYTSQADAFPAGRPRPVPSDLTFRDFDVPDTRATAVRLVPLANQCTGTPTYHGKQSADPLSTSDCRSTSAANHTRVAELMVYATDPAPMP
ncbi:M36 family metallopeptidase [Flindersiella endophytica]